MSKPTKIKKIFDCIQCKSYHVCKLRTSIGVAFNTAFKLEPIAGYTEVAMNCTVFMPKAKEVLNAD